MDVKELQRRYAAGQRDLSGINLSRADLNIAQVRDIEELEPGQNQLLDINLSVATMRQANLNFVNLKRSQQVIF